MEELVGLIAALIEAWKKGAKPGASIGPSGASGARGSASPAIASTTAKDRTGAQQAQAPRSALASAPGISPGPTLQSVGPVARAPEAGLVRGLFATPQSLVAAFIVAEVLAKPVALRER